MIDRLRKWLHVDQLLGDGHDHTNGEAGSILDQGPRVANVGDGASLGLGLAGQLASPATLSESQLESLDRRAFLKGLTVTAAGLVVPMATVFAPRPLDQWVITGVDQGFGVISGVGFQPDAVMVFNSGDLLGVGRRLGKTLGTMQRLEMLRVVQDASDAMFKRAVAITYEASDHA